MDTPDIDLLDEILADMAKQSVGKGGSSMGPSKQSINISNGPTSPDNCGSNSNGKSVRFSPSKPVSPPKDQMPPIPPPPPTIRTPTPPNMPNGHGMGLPNGKNPHGNHNTPLQIQVDTLHVPGDRSFLHSPSGDILAGNADGPVTPIMRTPSPRADYGLKSPTVLQKVITGGWVPTEKHADASEACPVFSANDNSDDARFQSYHLDYKYTPPPIKGPCCVCGDGIMGSMVTALDKMWHPEHFCCVHCHKELRPPHFTEHTGQPYCKACHNMLFLPPCAGCNKEIQGNYIQPMGKVWHYECFQCTQCTKVLNPNDFFERNGKPYCDDCRHDLFSPKCHGCKKPIKDDRKVSALGGLTWHPTCFKCCKCNGVMSPSNYKEKDNRLFCENCFNDLFMPKCGGCNAPVIQKPLQALGKQWHPACFKCVDCKKTLSPDKFKDNTGKPYCDDCYHNRFSEKCAGCREPIKDPKRMVKAQGKPWHPEHFCCTECNKQLDPNKFWEKDGKPYCEDDYHRLFSPKCGGCHQPIKNNKMVVAQGKKWHPEHFCCVECNRQLDPNKFWEKDGKAYCEDDFHRLFSPKCAGCLQPIKTKALVALGQHWHPEHFCCTICNKQLDEYQFYERDGKPYCVDDYLRLFAPHCKQCKKPITEAYCLSALGGDWHADCFRCRDCNCLLEDANFFEINGEPYCEQHFHARQCPDCIRIRRAQNTYFGLSADTPMQVRKYASMVSLKSLEINNGTGTRPTSQMSQYSQYSSSSMELGRCGTPNGQLTNGNGNGNGTQQILQRQVSSPPGSSSTYVIPIEREGASSSSALSNYNTSRSTSRNDNLYHMHDHNGQMCLSDHHVDNLLQRSSSQQSTMTNGSSSSQMVQRERVNALGGGKQVGWKKSQDNLQFIAKNQSPYLYNEPGKFPLLDGEGDSNKQIRFEEVMTKREYEAVQKRNY